ncbi:MAG TPA: hypothetical protein EYQ50_06230, partial [Verrucomicrobiales bacterium]|nr:hypothetical protein [Verrucomicrobiales bacterium]
MNNSKLVFQLLIKGCFLLSLITPSPLKSADQNWSGYLGGPDSSQYSTLKQIHKGNVKKLKQAWIYHCGDAASNGRSQIQCNPLIIDGVLYGTSPFLKLFALNAATGEELWNFDPLEGVKNAPRLGVNRGVVFWKEGSDRRILYCVDHYLYAVNADTGLPVAAFGDDGRVDLKIGLGRDVSKLAVLSNTPGAVFENLLFMPMRLGEGPGPAAPGHIRAYNIRTGNIVWKFNTIPSPEEFGYETWPPDAYQYIGGANVWTGMAVDHKRGLLFCPTGSAAFDFWGGNRIGENLFANCLLALDARTGKRVWHYQLVHHDLWDRDLPSPPNLITITRNGKEIDVVSQCTKSGHVFVFNRETGEPIYPIKETRFFPISTFSILICNYIIDMKNLYKLDNNQIGTIVDFKIQEKSKLRLAEMGVMLG